MKAKGKVNVVSLNACVVQFIIIPLLITNTNTGTNCYRQRTI